MSAILHKTLITNYLFGIMRYIYILLSFFFFSTALTAQVPGYQGKKMIIELTEGMFRFPLNVFKLPEVAKNIRFHTGIRLEYVTGRKAAWAIAYESFGRYETNIGYYSETAGNPLCSTTFKHRINTFGIQYVRYTRQKWCLAPVGRYWTFGMLYAPSNNTQVTTTTPTCKSPYNDYRTNNYFGSIGYGSRMVLWDKATVNFGAQFNIPLPARIFETVDTRNTEPFASIVKNNIIIDNIFKVYLNIGLLAF